MVIRNKHLIIILYLFTFKSINAQRKIVLKPGLSLGYGFNNIQHKLNTEGSFRSPKPGFTATLNGRLEYYFDPNSFINLSVKGSEAAFSFGFGIKKEFSYLYQTSVEYTQLNFAYNHYLLKEKPILKKLYDSKLVIRYKAGIGAGFNKNRNQDYYKLYFTNQYGGATTPLYSYWRLYTATPSKAIGCHFIATSGLSFYFKNREIIDINFEYNKGILNMTDVDLKYNINGNDYHVILGSKGSNFNLTIGIPITLYRYRE